MPSKNVSETTGLSEHDISMEQYREYDFKGRIYRIEDPLALYLRVGGATHRVVDSKGVAHCIPAPGNHGCVLRWKNKEGVKPVTL